ncbi:hypothetical protein XOCgx_0063 [Xanthomonas oryzae pv. oryzicola]|nr:hypothetical protein XOCgx_0063 [Xanthomonas oryzae pv. oryzicola]
MTAKKKDRAQGAIPSKTGTSPVDNEWHSFRLTSDDGHRTQALKLKQHFNYI